MIPVSFNNLRLLSHNSIRFTSPKSNIHQPPTCKRVSSFHLALPNVCLSVSLRQLLHFLPTKARYQFNPLSLVASFASFVPFSLEVSRWIQPPTRYPLFPSVFHARSSTFELPSSPWRSLPITFHIWTYFSGILSFHQLLGESPSSHAATFSPKGENLEGYLDSILVGSRGLQGCLTFNSDRETLRNLLQRRASTWKLIYPRTCNFVLYILIIGLPFYCYAIRFSRLLYH